MALGVGKAGAHKPLTLHPSSLGTLVRRRIVSHQRAGFLTDAEAAAFRPDSDTARAKRLRQVGEHTRLEMPAVKPPARRTGLQCVAELINGKRDLAAPGRSNRFT